MRKKLIIIYCVLIQVVFIKAEELSLKQAIEMALKTNPCLRESEERIAVAQAQMDQFRSAFSPIFNVGSSYTRTDLPMNAFGDIINQRSYNNGIDFNRPGTIDNLGIQGGIKYNIYRGGSDKASLEMAKHIHLSKQKDRKSMEQQLIFEVIRAFYNIKQTQEMLITSESAVKAFQENLNIAQLKYKAGTLLKDEVLKWEVQVAQATEDKIKNQHANAIAGIILGNLLGLKHSTIMAGKEDIIFSIPEQIKTDRSELQSIQSQISALESKMLSIKGEKLPSINTFVNSFYNKGWNTGGNGTCWSAGVRIDLNIWDGLLVSSKIRETQSEIRALREQKRKLELVIDLETEQSRLEVIEKQERFSVVSKMVKLAEETAILSRKRYTEGLLLTSDLISVEQIFTEAKMRYAIAKNEKILSVAKYRKSIGLTIY